MKMAKKVKMLRITQQEKGIYGHDLETLGSEICWT
jgi:hypothetical protein